MTPRFWLAGLAASAVLVASPYAASADALDLSTVSAHPARVTGGDVVVRVDLPRTLAPGRVSVRLNGEDVTGAFVPADEGLALVGLVTGLRLGENTLVADASGRDRGRRARLEVTNHPKAGPVFGGPHQEPWICETAASGLGEPLDADCTVTTRVDWFYRATDNTFKPLPDRAVRPADLAQTTTLRGATVDYVVRLESGTINKSIYRIAILDDPRAADLAPWAPGGRRPGAGWNGALNYRFGGGCGPAYRSGNNQPNAVLQHDALSLGFAVATATRNTLGNGCNDVVSAETLMMVKERFVEAYGLPAHTIGLGGSGGAMQQELIAHNYPGLLDALITQISYPDTVSIIPDVVECGLLNRYFNARAAAWPGTRRATVDGYPVDAQGRTTCLAWNTFANTWNNAFNGFSAVVPLSARYHPVTNPTGARGSYWDGLVNVYGTYPGTTIARSAFDNVGVQYGLAAVNAGDITVDEFLDINEQVGGLDVDGNWTPSRTEGDLAALRRAYSTGRVVSGRNLDLPIIDDRQYRDPFFDIHTRERTFSLAERLRRVYGTTDHRVIWTRPLASDGVAFQQMALRAHDEWLRALAADGSARPKLTKVIAAKPGWVTDACWDAANVKTEERAFYGGSGTSRCNTLFPSAGNVRLVAGAPLSLDVMKCQLRTPQPSDYRVAFSPAQWARLMAAFPEGVCDWSRRGVGQVRFRGGWQSFGQ